MSVFFEQVEYQPTPDTERYRLDSCIIHAEPALHLETEHLKWPSNLMAQLGLEATQTEEGLILMGEYKGLFTESCPAPIWGVIH